MDIQAKTMRKPAMNDVLYFMKDLDERYRQASGLSERRFFSIFYSQVIPSRLMLLGFNPGGNPATWDESLLASRSYYEDGEHEYVDFKHDSKFYRAMQAFLLRVLHLQSVAAIRKIPKTNLIFRRSSQSDSTFKRQQGIPISNAAEEARPFVEEILARVQPEVILLEGTTTLKFFLERYCTEVDPQVDGQAVTTPNGKNLAIIYREEKALVSALGRKVPLVAIGHPSKYGARREWEQVMSRAESLLYPIWSSAD
jgi:hypothetical protein